jgi:hypothetical protein
MSEELRRSSTTGYICLPVTREQREYAGLREKLGERYKIGTKGGWLARSAE